MNGGLLSGLFGSPQVGAQTRFGQGLDRLLAPEMALPMAAGLLSGRTNAEGFGNMFAAAGQAGQRNKTMEYLRKNDPEVAELVGAGLDIKDAYAIHQQRVKAQKPERPNYINAGDGQLFNDQTGEWISAPNSGRQKPPQVVELFDEGTGQPYKATWNTETGTYDRVGGVKAPSGMRVEMGPDGQFTLTQGPLGSGGGNANQNLNAGFLIRGRDAHATITELENQGTFMGNKILRNAPGGLGNYGLSPDAQKFEQAKRDFVNAVLRRESGAVISEEEFANADQQYFPQPGDSPQVIEQKRRNRENAVKAFELSAGPAAPPQTATPAAPQRLRFNPQTGQLE